MGALFNIHTFSVLNLYPLSNYRFPGSAPAFDALSDLVGDILFTCPMAQYARSGAESGHTTFYWLFGETPPCDVVYGMDMDDAMMKKMGPYHGITLGYFEGTSNNGTEPACLRAGEQGPLWD